MTSGKITSEAPLNVVELKEEIRKIEERDEELDFRTQRTKDYLAFVKYSAKKGKEIFTKIEELEVPRLKEIHIHKIIDIMPQSVEDLKVVLQGYTISVSSDNLKKIFNVLKDY